MKKISLFIIAISCLSFTTFSQIPSYIPVGMAAWYPFNGNTNDASQGGQNLLSSGVTFGADRFGNPNSAASFNGTSAYLNKQGFPGSPSSTYTISAWVKNNNLVTGSQEFGIVQLGKFSAAGNVSRCYMDFRDAQVRGIQYLGNQSVFLGAPGSSNWTHVGIEFDGNNAYLYINGAVAANTASGAPNSGAGDITIGAAFSNSAITNYFNGLIDDVVIYNGALPACQVNEIYRSCVLSTLGNQSANVGSSVSFIAPNSCYDENGITYQWQINNGVGGFQDITNVGQFQGATSKTLTMNNLSLSNNGWLVRCKLTYGCGAKTTSEATLSVLTVGNISTLDGEIELAISPNPASRNAILTSSGNLIGKTFRIFNALGMKVKEGEITGTTSTLDLSDLSNGVYTLQAAEIFSKRLIINK